MVSPVLARFVVQMDPCDRMRLVLIIQKQILFYLRALI